MMQYHYFMTPRTMPTSTIQTGRKSTDHETYFSVVHQARLIAMKLIQLICFAGCLGIGWAVQLSSLDKISLDFFPNASVILAARMSSSFIVNIPKCISSSQFTPTTIRPAVAAVGDKVAMPAVTDTNQIKSLHSSSTAQVYFAGEFKSVSCRIARDLVSMDIDDGNYKLTTVVGYQVGVEVCEKAKGPFCNRALQPSSIYRYRMSQLK
ncbi:hypothetical protein KIL84_019440 [Mauremys mutica]|uniref:Uncharacterized protein n=1 Tax=Mauremys mutica TaxID=74926 RepID=A0A9D4BAA3_9SAUR|nr:hypothetical protein KIL84_019440 [Mauremys mutica]